ncbi:unnamed protein product [Paramecium primaurelia]|uniref:G domain-containing protein n=1 Tax=Paramecium primaurelia TaxID=5886 RepID=A0A8S1LJP7_PARPR|nr:unnamed protein product [Paramecium primaurelia]
MDIPNKKIENIPEEKKLLEMSQIIQKLVEEFTRNTKNQGSVVLFVGSTGSGKSTTFNFLSGAEFKLNDDEELELKNILKNFSNMNPGLESVTKEPNFFYNESNKHLIIDFPGFLDTNGDWDQLLIELLFNKIVSLGELKIIYVLNNPQNTLQNRGSDLQEFLKQLDNPKINLILNCYMANWADEKLINKIKNDLEQVKSSVNEPKLIDLIDKILVKRKASNQDQLNSIFNNEQRQIFWKEIEELSKIKIKPRRIHKSEIISQYIISKATNIIQEYGDILSLIFEQNNNQEDEKYNQQQHQKLLQFQVLLKNKNKLSPLQWFLDFIKICEELTLNLYKSKSGDFLKIFQYFEQFQEFIDGYQYLDNINKQAQQNLQQVEKLFHLKIESQEKIKKAEEEKRRAEEDKRRAEEDKRKAEENKRKAEEEKLKIEQEIANQKLEAEKLRCQMVEQQREHEQRMHALEMNYKQQELDSCHSYYNVQLTKLRNEVKKKNTGKKNKYSTKQKKSCS